MATIQERYKRAYKVLEDEFDTMPKGDIEDICDAGRIDLMWLRNKASLWVDYEEDASMVIDGIQQDPNHPDNLSSIVWESFKHCKLGVFGYGELL